MDLTTIEAALDELYRRERHLPRPHGLAQTVLNACHEDPPGSAWYLSGVVAALWPIGAAAGAAQGHAVTVGAIRGEVAQALADPGPDGRGRWVVMGMVRAADDLAPGPDPDRRYGVLDAGQLVGDPRRLDQALTIGLANAWRAGHFDATGRVLQLFAAAVIDLVGHERLVTTFLIPTVTGEILLEEINFAAYRVAEHDREHPAPQFTQQQRAARPAAARAFGAVRRVDPHRRIPTNRHARPSTGPGRTRPGR